MAVPRKKLMSNIMLIGVIYRTGRGFYLPVG
jgi:hypothetical protein